MYRSCNKDFRNGLHIDFTPIVCEIPKYAFLEPKYDSLLWRHIRMWRKKFSKRPSIIFLNRFSSFASDCTYSAIPNEHHPGFQPLDGGINYRFRIAIKWFRKVEIISFPMIYNLSGHRKWASNLWFCNLAHGLLYTTISTILNKNKKTHIVFHLNRINISLLTFVRDAQSL